MQFPNLKSPAVIHALKVRAIVLVFATIGGIIAIHFGYYSAHEVFGFVKEAMFVGFSDKVVETLFFS